MVYKLPNGLWSEHPTSKQQALADKKPRYKTGEICPKCNVPMVQFTANDKCYNCSRIEALAFYRAHSGSEHCIRPYIQSDVMGDFIEYGDQFWEKLDSAHALVTASSEYDITPYPCKKGHVGFTRTGKCVECSEHRTPRQKALQSGEAWYTPLAPCPKCNTVSLKRVNNGECQGCVPEKPKELSAWGIAKEAGQKWYTPDTFCPKCGTKAARYVANGRCSGCA